MKKEGLRPLYCCRLFLILLSCSIMYRAFSIRCVLQSQDMTNLQNSFSVPLKPISSAAFQYPVISSICFLFSNKLILISISV